MGDVARARLEAELVRHFASEREAAASEVVDSLVSMMVTEDEGIRYVRPQRMGLAAFVSAQVRYIPAWTWAAQVSIVLLMCAVAHMTAYPEASKLAIGILSAATVLVGVPTLSASRTYRMAELEYACANNAASVMVARLIVLGCSSALTVGLMVAAAATTLDASAVDMALWTCPPFFLSCAGSLMALRKVPPATAAMFCAAWTTACSVGLMALASSVPDLYAQASLVAWAIAAAIAFAWLAREVAMTFRMASAGLDAFSPHLARTYN